MVCSISRWQSNTLQHKACRMMQLLLNKHLIAVHLKGPPLQVQNTEASVIGIRYTSGRRGNV